MIITSLVITVRGVLAKIALLQMNILQGYIIAALWFIKLMLNTYNYVISRLTMNLMLEERFSQHKPG
ncbi:hypothetical protein ACOMICROBIO_NCLOACGD_01414 [Vibrio sp. B1ASS3]|nr:hypothetical protein ACOMICROBIO_NCLOACGD_01414 [Vibrio sp. B1ASS3]CAE6899469.1 hypothetical protein ACOMICROBIO_NCLOACGD_01414 [Vibrio sp. B1ASS3]